MRALLLLLLAAPASSAPSRTAGAVVLSDEWTVRREKGEEEFKGNVRVEQGKDRVSADWAIHHTATDHWQVRGKVSAQRTVESGETLKVTGNEGRLDRKTGKAELTGKPVRAERRFTGTDGAERTWTATAPKAAWEAVSGAVTLDGGVTLEAEGLQARSASADVDTKGRAARLKGGRPVVVVERPDVSAAIQADSVTVTDSPRTVSGEGGVLGWLRLKPREPR